MQVSNEIKHPTFAIYQDPSFRGVLVHHLELLKARATDYTPPTPLAQHEERGDFRMVLLNASIPYHMHWLIMRINGIVNPFKWDMITTKFKLIDENDEMLLSIRDLFNLNKK